MPIDNFRRPPRRSMRPNSIDGVFNARSKPLPKVGDLNPISTHVSRSSEPRQIGSFTQADGFNPSRRPLMPANLRPKGPQLTAPPELVNLELPETIRKRHFWQRIGPSRRRRRPPQKVNKLARYAKVSGLAMGVLIVFVGGFLLFKGYMQLRHVFGGGGSAIALAAPGRINILVMGIGGGNHDGPDLTDSMMLASIDPVNNKVLLLSIPRDLWVKMPNSYVGQYAKINAAYESGKYAYLGRDDASNSNQKAIEAGFHAVDQTVSQVFNVSINYNVLVDFQAFQQAVDAVGGITINVPTELYDPTIAWQNNWNPVIARPGIQHMNGSEALLYARSRETTSDFARAQRQRDIAVALKDKALTLGTFSNPLKISSLMSAFGDNVRTDISLNDAEALYNMIKKVSNNNIQSVGLAGSTVAANNYITTGFLNGQSIDEPIAGLFNYKPMQGYVHQLLRDGYLSQENAKILILNGSNTSGVATDLANKLEYYGYPKSSIAVGNASASNYNHIELVDLSHGKDSHTRDDLEKTLGISTAATALPDTSIQTNGADFVIIVGQ